MLPTLISKSLQNSLASCAFRCRQHLPCSPSFEVALCRQQQVQDSDKSVRILSCYDSATMSSKLSIGEGNNVTFWQRLKRQKNGLGNMALAASTLILALRLIEKDKELEQMKAGESSLLNALRRENRTVQERFAGFRAAVEEEIGLAGSRLPPLSSRIQILIERSNSEEPRPLVSHEVQRGQESETLRAPAKGKSSFMV